MILDFLRRVADDGRVRTHESVLGRLFLHEIIRSLDGIGFIPASLANLTLAQAFGLRSLEDFEISSDCVAQCVLVRMTRKNLLYLAFIRIFGGRHVNALGLGIGTSTTNKVGFLCVRRSSLYVIVEFVLSEEVLHVEHEPSTDVLFCDEFTSLFAHLFQREVGGLQ